MIILNATAPIKPEARERWLAILSALTPPSRAEEACHSYIVYEAIETPNTFIFVEKWTSLEGLYAHFRTPHFVGGGDLLSVRPLTRGAARRDVAAATSTAADEVAPSIAMSTAI